MSKPNYNNTFGHRIDWRFDSNWRSRKDNQQTKQSDAQDSRDSVQNKRDTDSEQSESKQERNVKFKHGDDPVRPFEITLSLIEQMTNEACE